MRSLTMFKFLLATAPIVTALTLTVGSQAAAYSQNRAAARPQMISHSSLSHISPPHAGVKLLEDILARMRNLPQIAMNKKMQSFNYQQVGQTANAQPGATNPILAIKPPLQKQDKAPLAIASAPRDALRGFKEQESGGRSDWRAESSREGLDKMKQARARYAGGGGGQSGAGAGALAGAKSRIAALPAPTPHSAASPAPSKAAYPAGGYAGDPLVFLGPSDHPIQGALKDAESRLSPEARRRLSQSTAKLYDAARKFEIAQQLPAAGKGGAAPSPSQSDSFYADGGQAKTRSKVISTNPLITEYNERQQNQIAANARRHNFQEADEANAPMLQGATNGASGPPQEEMLKGPAEPGLFKHVREFFGGQDDAKRFSQAESQAEGLAAPKPIEIALLPPNVVTGIPLVRLGCAESEVNKTLSNMGAVNRTSINGWSVWSLKKSGSKEESLQVYMRNGSVEAIRIFDRALIAPDFGVKLGDSLPTVKQKFGEPSFMVQEPASMRGQNYVYPLSQVSFQLARPTSKSKPQVVSLLIFNAR